MPLHPAPTCPHWLSEQPPSGAGLPTSCSCSACNLLAASLVDKALRASVQIAQPHLCNTGGIMCSLLSESHGFIRPLTKKYSSKENLSKYQNEILESVRSGCSIMSVCLHQFLSSIFELFIYFAHGLLQPTADYNEQYVACWKQLIPDVHVQLLWKEQTLNVK